MNKKCFQCKSLYLPGITTAAKSSVLQHSCISH